MSNIFLVNFCRQLISIFKHIQDKIRLLHEDLESERELRQRVSQSFRSFSPTSIKNLTQKMSHKKSSATDQIFII